MEDRKKYLWRVAHPVHGEIEVEASDRYSAVLAAAHDWGLRWSTIARDCRTECLAEVKERIATPASGLVRNDRKDAKGSRKNERGGSKGGKADKKKQRNH